MRRDKESVDESPQLASFAEEPPPRLPRGAPQGPRLRDQQNAAPVQGTPRLIKLSPSFQRAAFLGGLCLLCSKQRGLLQTVDGLS